MVESLPTAVAFPKRPNRDGKSQGQEIKLFSNYFSIEFDSPAI
jgi:hypothetical protein